MRLSYFELPPKTRKAIDDVLSVKSVDAAGFNRTLTSRDQQRIPLSSIGRYIDSGVDGGIEEVLNIGRNVDRWIEALDFIGVEMTDEIRDELMPYLLCGNDV